jgi:hypothetical protein
MISKQSRTFEFQDGEYIYGFYFYEDDAYTGDSVLQIALTRVKNNNNVVSYSGPYSGIGLLISLKTKNYCDSLLKLPAFW